MIAFTNEAVGVKVREVIKRIEADGWYLARVRGDHRHYKHPTKKGIVTVSGLLERTCLLDYCLVSFNKPK
jgi:predicted RNA binding protein YcfA (HicA-like mRNA interferase family)